MATIATHENVDKRAIYLEKDVYTRWCNVGAALGVSTDSLVASFLIQQFEKIRSGVPSGFPCLHCQHSLTLFCSWCNFKIQTSVAQNQELLTSEGNDEVTSMRTNPTEDVKDVALIPPVQCRDDLRTDMPAAAHQQQAAKEMSSSSHKLSSAGNLSLVNVQLGSVNACILRTQTESNVKSVFMCAECNASFETHKSLLDHGEKVHGLSHPQKTSQVLFCCGSCELIFTSKKSLDKHEKTHHVSDVPQALEGCTVTFSTDVSEKGNKQKPIKKKKWVCTRCVTSFTSVVLYKRHMRSHGVTRPFACDKCTARFKTRANLKVHNCNGKEDSNNSLRGLKDSESTNKQGGKSENRTETEPEGEQINTFTGIHVCQQCGKVLTSNSNLQKHILRFHTSPEDRPHVCDICGQGFSSKFDLQRHQIRHNGERTHICDVCGSAFMDRYALNRHKKKHSADRRISICEVCGASFADRFNLKNHMRVHTGEKPHKCSYCDASFRLRCVLQKHERMHKGERKFICSECGRGFIEREYWRSHMRTHTGERPFVCDVCGTGFAQKGSLNAHKKTHTTAQNERDAHHYSFS